MVKLAACPRLNEDLQEASDSGQFQGIANPWPVRAPWVQIPPPPPMTKETNHFHQSEKLSFLDSDYLPYQKGSDGLITYGTITFIDGKFLVKYTQDKPAYGGYIAQESIYGNPDYCPNATRQHRIHLKEYGSTPHLVFFDSAKSAEQAGFRRCKRCKALGQNTSRQKRSS